MARQCLIQVKRRMSLFIVPAFVVLAATAHNESHAVQREPQLSARNSLINPLLSTRDFVTACKGGVGAMMKDKSDKTTILLSICAGYLYGFTEGVQAGTGQTASVMRVEPKTFYARVASNPDAFYVFCIPQIELIDLLGNTIRYIQSNVNLLDRPLSEAVHVSLAKMYPCTAKSIKSEHPGPQPLKGNSK